MLKEELTTLESLREGFAHRLLDDPRTCKSYQCLRLGDVDISQHRETGRHSTHRRIGQHRYEWDALLPQPCERGAGLGHLQQREQPFLHPRPTAGSKRDQRYRAVHAGLHRPYETLSHDRAHGATQEAELEGDADNCDTPDLATHGYQRVILRGRLLSLCQAVLVLLTVPKFERINGDQLGAHLFALVGVEKSIQTAACIDPHVMTAFGTNFEIALELHAIEHGAAARALGPEPFRHVAFAAPLGANTRGQQLLEPAHMDVRSFCSGKSGLKPGVSHPA